MIRSEGGDLFPTTVKVIFPGAYRSCCSTQRLAMMDTLYVDNNSEESKIAGGTSKQSIDGLQSPNQRWELNA